MCKENGENICRQLQISQKALVQWQQYLREEYFRLYLVELGGPGTVFEIDESVMFKGKYHRERMVPQRWVFGAIRRGTKQCIIVSIVIQKRATLLEFIQQHVLPGTEIHSDQWAAYL